MDVSTPGKAFLDTNVPVYALDSDEPQKQAIAQGVMRAAGALAVVSGQVLGELYWIGTHKLGLSREDARTAVELLSGVTVVPIDRQLVIEAIDLMDEASITYWDALIVKAASRAGCTRLLTEDLNHGQIIDGVRVENPFREV